MATTPETLQTLKDSLEVIEAEAAKIGATLSISFDPEDEAELYVWYIRASALEIQEQQRQDVAWLKTHLEDKMPAKWRLRGCYVAVLKQRIVAVGPSQKLTKMQVKHRLDAYLASCAVIVWVQEPGDDADKD